MAPSDAVEEKRDFMSVVRRVAKPFAAQGWSIGTSGLKRQADTGHWAHFWFVSSRFNQPLVVSPFVGTISPYLLRVFNRQRVDRAPHANFIAVHSQLGPIERSVHIVDETDGVPPAQTPFERALSRAELPSWLEQRFNTFLPQLASLLCDEALFTWLTDEDRAPSSVSLRYAALLAYHLRRDEDVEQVLARAGTAAQREDDAAIARGVDLSYRSDRQTTYPQDWSHARFVAFLHASPRD